MFNCKWVIGKNTIDIIIKYSIVFLYSVFSQLDEFLTIAPYLDPGLLKPRYALSQIEEIEEAGLRLNPMSPVHRRRLERSIEELERKVKMYKAEIENVKIALG